MNYSCSLVLNIQNIPLQINQNSLSLMKIASEYFHIFPLFPPKIVKIIQEKTKSQPS